MPTAGRDPVEFFDLAQQMLRELFGDPESDREPVGGRRRLDRRRSEIRQGGRQPSAPSGSRSPSSRSAPLARPWDQATTKNFLNGVRVRQVAVNPSGRQTTSPGVSWIFSPTGVSSSASPSRTWMVSLPATA